MCAESFEKELDNVLFRTYEKRLSSFAKWKGKVKPEQLARAGFYYLSIDDVCKCFYCGSEIFQWTYDDCPIEEHHKLWKNCDLSESLWLSKNKHEEITKCENMSWVVFLCLLNIFSSIYLSIF